MHLKKKEEKRRWNKKKKKEEEEEEEEEEKEEEEEEEMKYHLWTDLFCSLFFLCISNNEYALKCSIRGK